MNSYETSFVSSVILGNTVNKYETYIRIMNCINTIKEKENNLNTIKRLIIDTIVSSTLKEEDYKGLLTDVNILLNYLFPEKSSDKIMERISSFVYSQFKEVCDSNISDDEINTYKDCVMEYFKDIDPLSSNYKSIWIGFMEKDIFLFELAPDTVDKLLISFYDYWVNLHNQIYYSEVIKRKRFLEKELNKSLGREDDEELPF